jgi:malate permease and related proteins
VDALAQLAPIVLPVFVCAGVGLLWHRLGKPFDADRVASLVYNIGVPCLIIATFSRVRLSPAAVAEIAVVAVIAYLVFAAIGALVLRGARLPLPSYLPSMIFPLTGSLGLPVSLFAFGDEGLALALVFFTVGAVGTFTIGAAIAEGRMSAGAVLRTPAVYAVLIAVGMLVLDLRMPQWIVNSTGLLGGFAIPMQLIALGTSLGRMRVRSLGRSTALAALRLGMGFAVGVALAAAFGLEGVARAVIVIQCAMPVAVSNYMFAVIHNREPEEVAGMVVVSTAISFFTLPLLLLAVL